MGYSFKNFSKAQKVQIYAFQNKPAIRSDSLFCDGTRDYRIPAEPKVGDQVKLKFRTAKFNADTVYVICDGQRYQMVVGERDQRFDYYEVTIPALTEDRVEYYFEIVSGNAICYYNKLGVPFAQSGVSNPGIMQKL